MIALYIGQVDQDSTPYAQQVIDCLAAQQQSVLVFGHPTKGKLDLSNITHSTQATDIADCDAVCSLGGDGTLLEAVSYLYGRELPIFGINLGRLGFLSCTPKHTIAETMALFFAKKYRYDLRSVVEISTHAETTASDDDISELRYGLNEFVILRRDLSAMVEITCWVDDGLLGRIWADGMMVTTPTGSTAYSMSCGGPITSPACNSWVLTPINPHNLSMRSVVVPDSCTIRLRVTTRAKRILVSLDSRSKILPSDITFVVKKAAFGVRLIEFEGYDFFRTLREKLSWGEDIRLKNRG